MAQNMIALYIGMTSDQKCDTTQVDRNLYDAIKLANSGVDGLNQGYRADGTNKTTSPANRAEGQGVPR